MVEWIYVTGDKDKLAVFSFGVGVRGDPTPVTSPYEVQKELSTFNQILSTFTFTQDPEEKCANYSNNGTKTEYCATCGNNICEEKEMCSSSGCSGNICLPDCGPLYCPKDCQQ